MRFRRSFLMMPLAVFLLAGVAFAKGAVEGTIEAFIVHTDAKGVETIKQTRTAEPGQVMEYRLSFSNNGEDAVKGLKIVDPIPSQTTFIPQSDSTDVTADFEVSIDGGKTFETEPVLRIETRADGSQIEITIPPEQYTHLRWNAKDTLNSGGEMQVYSYRVRVN